MSTERLTEILNYLSAMSRDIGAFRSETTSHFDAIEVRLDRLEGRMAGLETREDGLEREVRTGFEQVRADIRIINYKFDVTAKDSLELRAGHLDLERRVEALERRAGTTDSV